MSICGYNRTKKRIQVHNHWLQVLEKVNPWSWQNITQYIKMDECPFQLCITSAAEKSSSIKSKSQQSIKFHAISCQTFKLISFDKANQVLFCLGILLYLSIHPLSLHRSISFFFYHGEKFLRNTIETNNGKRYFKAKFASSYLFLLLLIAIQWDTVKKKDSLFFIFIMQKKRIAWISIFIAKIRIQHEMNVVSICFVRIEPTE